MRALLMVLGASLAPASVAVTVTTAAAAEGLGDLYVVKAREAVERGDDHAAMDFVEAARKAQLRGTPWAYARMLGARAALRAGRAARAIEYAAGLETDLAVVADFVVAVRARALQQLGDTAGARQAWQQLVSAQPDSPLAPEARFAIADTYFEERSNDAAEMAYEAALQDHSHDIRATPALYHLALLAEARGHFARAGAIYRDLATKAYDETTAGRAAARLETLIEQAHVVRPSLDERLAYFDRLLSAYSLAAAEQALLELKNIAPNMGGVMLREGRLAIMLGDYDAAIRVFSDLSLRHTGWQRYRYLCWLARAQAASGQYDEAVQIYEGLAQRYRHAPEGPATLYMAAWLSLDGGDYRRALRLFDEFLQLYPRDRRADEAMWYKAWNAYHLGELADADLALDELRRRFPDSALIQRAQYWQGRIMTQMAYAQEAIASFEAAMAGEPGYYATLAEQRIEEFSHEPNVREWEDGSSLLASLEVPPPGGTTATAAAPRVNRRTVLWAKKQLSVDWGQDVFDWQSPAAERALTLIQLAYPEQAAAIIARLPARADVAVAVADGDAVTYARARLLHALGDYGGAYERIMLAFPESLQGGVTRQTLPLFQLAYPLAYERLIDEAANEFGVPRLLLLAVMRQESAFRTRARSWASAAGLMQIIPSTGRRIAAALGTQGDDRDDRDDRDDDDHARPSLADPRVSIRFGAWYLGQLLTKFNGNVALAVGSYNAGPRAMERWIDARADGRALDEFIEDISYRETRHYVKRVLANLAVYRELYGDSPLRLADDVASDYQNNVDF